MDTVAKLSDVEDDEGAIRLDFEKTRLKTPANADQFQPVIMWPSDNWRVEAAAKAGAGRVREKTMVEIARAEFLNAYDRLADGIINSPGARASGIVADRISLKNRIDIEVRPASFRTIRGITSVVIIAEEILTWQSDESLNPDFEILAAARPSLATTVGPMIAIGSPRVKRGETWCTFKKHFGPDGNPAIIVANGATKTFNPTIRQAVIDRAFEDDAQVAAASGAASSATISKATSRQRLSTKTRISVALSAPTGQGFNISRIATRAAEAKIRFAYRSAISKTGSAYSMRLSSRLFSPSAVISDLCAFCTNTI